MPPTAISSLRPFRGVIFFLCGALCLATAQETPPRTPAGPKDFERGEGGSFMRKRMDWDYNRRAYPHKRIPAGARLRALKELDVKLAKEAEARAQAGKDGSRPQSSAWTLIGPEPENNVFWGPNSGRVAAIAVDPTNTNVVYTGAAQGGVWKTSDGGVTWNPLTDQQASLAIGSLAIDPQNHLTLYAGTGEENNSGDSYYGAGILKSTDGGTTWTNIPGPFAGGGGGGARIGGIAVSPANSNVVLAAAGCCPPNGWGVYRSADAGNTWAQVLDLNYSQAYNVLFDPSNGNLAYAAIDANGVYKSSDGGVTWNPANGSGSSTLPTGPPLGRVALAMDPNASATLYAGLADNGTNSLRGLYKTTDGGNTWSQLVNTPDYCSGQCWYDNVIAVMPGNSNVIYAGGNNPTPVQVSIDGGNSWTNLNFLGIHPDLHALVFTPNGQKLYIGNDGGMYSATNPASTSPTIANLNAQLATLQFYSGASIDPNNVNSGYAGTQDNLSNKYSGALGWQDVDCGDGGQTVIDFSNTNNVYVNCITLSLDKSTDGGASFQPALNGINTSDPTNWVPPLVMDPSNSQRLYFGTNHVYQTTNGAGLWTAISPDLTTGNGNQLVALAVAPTDPNTIYAGTSDVQLQVTTNALAGASATWTNVSSATALPNRSITALVGDPHLATTAYVTFSGFTGFGDSLGHVFKTANTGANWIDISGDLPNIPVNAIVVDPISSGTIYIGTDIGTFYTTSGGTSWATLGTGLPRVADYGLAYQAAQRTLWVSTHGRSIWSLNVAAIEGLPSVTSIAPSSAPVGSAAFTLTVNGATFVSGAVVQWNGAALSTTFVNSSQLTATVPAGDLLTAGTVPVSVLSGGQLSNSVPFSVTNPVPTATSLSPTGAVAGGPAFTLTVNGTNLVATSSVLWNGSARTTTFVSSTQLTVAISAADIAVAGTANVSVSNPAPGGGTSNTLAFAIGNPVPSLTSLSPTSKNVGSATFTLSVKGTNFVHGATVDWNGSVRSTVYKSGVLLTATITANDLKTAGNIPVTAFNPLPGGGISNALTFAVKNLKPSITSLSPTSATAGGNAFTLTVNGKNFVSTSAVNWNGTPRTTTFVNPTKITAAITAADIAKAGTSKITVSNPAPGGGSSAPVTFTINNPAPTLTSISPNSATHGGAAFTLTATGTNYVSTSVVQWNGKKLTTTFVSATTLTAAVPSSDIKTAGTASVTVNTPAPGGGTSAAKTFTIN